jgi:hypothetical protein
MLAEDYPPEGSNISMKFTPGGVTYTWPTEPRGGAGPESMGAVLFLIFTMFFLGYAFVVLFNGGSNIKSINKGINFGHLFFGLLLLMILLAIFRQGRTIYLTLRRPLPASIEITPNEIIYRTGTKRPQLRFDGRGRVDSKDKAAERLKSKTYAFPIKEREHVNLERRGDYLLLSVEYRGESVEIGSSLKETDKEWLYKALHR